MSCKIAVWLDHKRAFLVTARDRDVSTRTIEFEEAPPSHAAGGLRSAAGHGQHGVDPDARFDARQALYRQRYYDQIIVHLGEAERIHLMGPGQAKLELRRKILDHKPLTGRPLSHEACDRMTDAQIVAHVRTIFGLGLKRSARG